MVLEDTDVSPNVVGFAELALDNYRDLNTDTQPDRNVLQGSVILRGYQGYFCKVADIHIQISRDTKEHQDV